MLTTNINFDKIVDKTKRMLGKNYLCDKEFVPVYSTFVPIEGHTDAFSAISNAGFTKDDLTIIKEKTRTYSWWVANKGWLVDETKREIPALFIYGNEEPVQNNVLNINGDVIFDFYKLIKVTSPTGINELTKPVHMYIQFQNEGLVESYDSDLADLSQSQITLNTKNYQIFSGRLYPEDKKIIDTNIIYPINLISNLDYYNIPAEGSEGERLEGAHDTTYVEQNNLEILEDTCEMVIYEAAQWTNRPSNERLLNDCWPVIVKCACIAYLNRGAEGLHSQSELGQQNAYIDWITVLHQQIMNRRYVM